jgi:hypothetical protein
MAVLGESDRVACWAESMLRLLGPVSITKAQLRAVVNAIDDWADANTTSFNNAIPQPQRGILTATQKALIFMIVVARRHLVGA